MMKRVFVLAMSLSLGWSKAFFIFLVGSSGFGGVLESVDLDFPILFQIRCFFARGGWGRGEYVDRVHNIGRIFFLTAFSVTDIVGFLRSRRICAFGFSLFLSDSLFYLEGESGGGRSIDVVYITWVLPFFTLISHGRIVGYRE